LPVINPGLWTCSPSGEEDVPGRGNPVVLGNITAVFWLAPEGVVEKGDPLGGIRNHAGPALTLRGSR
tara:strand:+ start:105452 stop:105652 length:201 start_codon:yes stop_codon:yes gene_type:complete